MPRCTSIVIFIIRRIFFFLAKRFLLFVLPLPFFPNVTAVLAKLFGINPLELKQVNIPTPKLKSFIPTSLIPKFMMAKHDQVSQMKPIPTDPTISLGEKIRTWRQRQIVNERIMAPARIGIPTDSRRAPRKKIDQVDFESSVEGMDKIITDSMGTIQQV
jgi:hypothetical protein